MPLQEELKTLEGEELNDRGDYIITRSGIKFYATDPQAEDVNIFDIAWALSMVNRWTGHTSSPMSVAEHSILVSQLVPEEFALYGLLHDASEAYIADIARPFKPYFDNYKEIEANIMAAVSEKFDLNWTAEVHDAVDRADRSMLIVEARQLFHPDYTEWTHAPALLEQCYPNIDAIARVMKVGTMNHTQAYNAFLNRIYDLLPPEYMVKNYGSR